MNRLRIYAYLLVIIMFCASSYAQQDTLSLNEITITEKLLKDFSSHQNTKILSSENQKSLPIGLSQLLNTEASIALRENGKGMVASPSFRGTTAAQTAVIWNGININSTLLGQVDFNLLNASDFQQIAVKSGGGSSLYGSSAIGGSIHLNTQLFHDKPASQKISLMAGSFDTYHLNHQWRMRKNKLAFQSALSYTRSENDYPYIGFNNKNENGQFQNISGQWSLGYQFNERFKLQYHAHLFKGYRHFSGTLSTLGRSKYKNLDSRHLLDLGYLSRKGQSWHSKFAFLIEDFQYFEDFNFDLTSNGIAKTLLHRQEFLQPINDKMSWHAHAEYNYQWVEGSQMSFAQRHTAAFATAFKHQLFKNLDYDLGLRYEKSTFYTSPLLYSFQSKWQPVKSYAMRLIHSKNFRIPTFNDLFWPGSGHVNLKPEESLQFDLSNDFIFKNGQLTFTYFHNQMTDMIRWLPNLNGLWQPINTQAVEINGFEGKFQYNQSFNQFFTKLDLQYSYTSSKDLETNKQLIYVPFHRVTSQLTSTYKNWQLIYHLQFNGAVFTNGSNSDFLKEYALSHVFLSYNFEKYLPINLQFQMMNIENRFYQNVLSRPLPGRHFNFILRCEI